MSKRAFVVVALAVVLSGCSSDKDRTVIVECRRPDGLLAFYGPAERVRFQITGYRDDPVWVIYNGEGLLNEPTYIPADCTCIATERISK